MFIINYAFTCKTSAYSFSTGMHGHLTLDNVVVRRRLDGVFALSLSVYRLMLIILLFSYWRQKKALEQEQLVDDLLSDKES
ncbi:MAG: hypothetical protein ICV81_17285 [Flavisolibacter sp.]|nr:hypothetical protein [Flavisolibacter sp.]